MSSNGWFGWLGFGGAAAAPAHKAEAAAQTKPDAAASGARQADPEAASFGETPDANPLSKIVIPPVEDQVWRNPWYPLAGPPQTPEEQEIFEKHTQKVRESVRDGIVTSQAAKRRLDDVAKEYCIDLELDFNLCARRKMFGTGCVKEYERMLECVQIHKRNLAVLGFQSAKPMTYSERQAIIDKADQMYLDEMAARAQSADKA
ncbi:hypothetical protein HK105_205682 [Polyrhizophydium stewartii]|uniref:COX assembly mitochondrial protein n=1 Tax=Polyrhizophydium stewartii TaxID=2732419 RepID=A0ABR4N5E0_9FUNG|nr:hypothetical protein HK105_000390 [Polyrhizophydium stewartii]